jgi:hypothetical protein
VQPIPGSKKTQVPVPFVVRPPSSGRPSSKTRLKRMYGPASASKHSLNKNPCLPPVGRVTVGADSAAGHASAAAEADGLESPAWRVSGEMKSSGTLGPEATKLLARLAEKAFPSASNKAGEHSQDVGNNNNVYGEGKELPDNGHCSSLTIIDKTENQTGSSQSTAAIPESAKLHRTLSSVKEDVDSYVEKSTSSSRPPTSEKNNNKAEAAVEVNNNEVTTTSSVKTEESTAKKPVPPVSSRKKESRRKDYSSYEHLAAARDIQQGSISPKRKDYACEPMKVPLPFRNIASSMGIDSYESPGRPMSSFMQEHYGGREDGISRPTTSSRYTAGLDRKQGIVLESLGQSEARAMSGFLRQASIERIGSSKISNLVTSASKTRPSYSAYKDMSSRIPTPENRLLVSKIYHVSTVPYLCKCHLF